MSIGLSSSSLSSRAFGAGGWSWAALLIVMALFPIHHGQSLQMNLSPSGRRRSSLQESRARFLASTGTAFLTSTSISHPDERNAAARDVVASSSKSPRYIERELQMNMSDNNPRTRGLFVRRYTGDSTPYQFPVKPIPLVQPWPDAPPFTAADFKRSDPMDDKWFYSVPKLVYHIDEPAVAALTQYYRNNIPTGSRILDICSSWVSHYPLEFPQTMKVIAATGISATELQFNDQLTAGYEALDLNAAENPKLPYPDASFDVVTCVVSIDYLIYPIAVLKEVHRVLRPGGKVIVSQSNRCFPRKAISMWLKMNDRQHLELINGYFQYAGGFVEPRQAFDITATLPGGNPFRDPMYIVQAVKEG